MTPKTVARRSVIVTLCAIGLSSVPAAAAPLTVSSGQLSAYRSCTLTVRAAGAVQGMDAQIQQDSPDNNTNNNDMDVSSETTKNRRVYLSFDLTRCIPQVPAAAPVTSATLRLFGSSLPSACRTHDVFRVGSAWTESGITWNNQPFGTALNNPATGQRTAAMDVGAAPCQNSTNNAYVSGWNVTTDVAAFVAGTATNNGWMIRDDVEASSTVRLANFKTKNANNAVQSPQLIINYM